MTGVLKSSGTAVSMVGATAVLSVNTWPKGSSALYSTSNVTLSTASGGGIEGGFAVTVPAVTTAAWPANGPNMPPDNRLIYDLVVTLSGGSQVVVLSGLLLVEEIAG